jgi:hypothetical protein
LVVVGDGEDASEASALDVVKELLTTANPWRLALGLSPACWDGGSRARAGAPRTIDIE